MGSGTIHEFEVKATNGGVQSLGMYRGKVVLLVNVASRCGYTPQYSGLEALHRKYKDRGLVVLGFPANDFGGQEPGTDEEIQKFCKSKYDVTFPVLSKITVLGPAKAPLYRFLTSAEANAKTAGEVKWNFTKFLADKDGRVIARFEPKVAPDAAELTGAIEAALAR